ncbi:phage pi2 protein 07 [Lysinibacillus parviboronicapiens]|uniref:Phage pi2 protein 07 n=1 Tax=Lysinibacillus parviboronicapiens TaxID=436516 RepID=A0ABV2PJ64_9BACI
MQQLQVNLTVPVPDDYVLINRIEYEELQTHFLSGVYWTMVDLENRIGKKQVWIKENILYLQKFKKQLDVSQGGFVYYPKAKGEKWSFLASKMSQFLEDNFYTIFKG